VRNPKSIVIGRIQPTTPATALDAQRTTNTSETSKAHILRTSHVHRSRAFTRAHGVTWAAASSATRYDVGLPEDAGAG
jgi:hypothetical protein